MNKKIDKNEANRFVIKSDELIKKNSNNENSKDKGK